MNVFDERLRRLKYSHLMAVTQRGGDLPPAFLTVPAAPLSRAAPWFSLPPVAPGTATTRRVRARMVQSPAASPSAQPPAAWPGATFTPESVWIPEDPAAFTGEPSDPYEDDTQVLAEGLTSTPPAQLPPLMRRAAEPEAQPPAPHVVAPVRPASFAETMALNTAQELAAAPPFSAPAPTNPGSPAVPPAAVASPAAPSVTASAVPAAVLPVTSTTTEELPVDSAAPVRAGASPAATPVGQPAAPAPKATLSREAPARLDTPSAPLQPDLVEAAPTQAAQPPEQVSDQEFGQMAPPAIWQDELAGPVVPGPTSVPTNEVAASAAAVQPRPDVPGPDSQPAVQATEESRQDVEASPTEAPAVPDAEPPAAEPDAASLFRERQELAAFLRQANNGLPVSLPRRQRPKVAAVPPPQEEEIVVPPPPDPEVSQNFLARLNRFAEMEEAGETDEVTMPFDRLRNWEDHHPEQNVNSVPDSPERSFPAAAAVPVPSPALAVGPAPARVKARATQTRRKEGQTPASRPNRSDDADSEDESLRDSPVPSALRSTVAPLPAPVADVFTPTPWAGTPREAPQGHPATGPVTPDSPRPERQILPVPALQADEEGQERPTGQPTPDQPGGTEPGSRPPAVLAPVVPLKEAVPLAPLGSAAPSDVPGHRPADPARPAAVPLASPGFPSPQVKVAPLTPGPVQHIPEPQPDPQAASEVTPRPTGTGPTGTAPWSGPEHAAQPVQVPVASPVEIRRPAIRPVADQASPQIEGPRLMSAPVRPPAAQKPGQRAPQVAPSAPAFPPAAPPVRLAPDPEAPGSLRPTPPLAHPALAHSALVSPAVTKPSEPVGSEVAPQAAGRPGISSPQWPRTMAGQPAPVASAPPHGEPLAGESHLVPAAAVARPPLRPTVGKAPRAEATGRVIAADGPLPVPRPVALPTARHEPPALPALPSTTLPPVQMAPPRPPVPPQALAAAPELSAVQPTALGTPAPVARAPHNAVRALEQATRLSSAPLSEAVGSAAVAAAPQMPALLTPEVPALMTPGLMVPVDLARGTSAGISTDTSADPLLPAPPWPMSAPALGAEGAVQHGAPPFSFVFPPTLPAVFSPTLPRLAVPGPVVSHEQGVASVLAAAQEAAQFSTVRDSRPTRDGPTIRGPTSGGPTHAWPTTAPGFPVPVGVVPRVVDLGLGSSPPAEPAMVQSTGGRPALGRSWPLTPPLSAAPVWPDGGQPASPAHLVPAPPFSPGLTPQARRPGNAPQAAAMVAWPAPPTGFLQHPSLDGASPVRSGAARPTAAEPSLSSAPLPAGQATPLRLPGPIWPAPGANPEFPRVGSAPPLARPGAERPVLVPPAALSRPTLAGRLPLPSPVTAPVWAEASATPGQTGADIEPSADIAAPGRPSAGRSGLPVPHMPVPGPGERRAAPTAPATPRPVATWPPAGPAQAAWPAAPLPIGAPTPLMTSVQRAIMADGHGHPLPPGAQRALESTLGTSVRDIRVVRHAAVQEALTQARADALTVGRTVLLPAQIDLDTPAGHALAAHELTHALRYDRPDFVPSVLGQGPRAQDEEGVALATEHAAFAQAQRAPGLPAPWEPMPFWSSEAPAVPVPRVGRPAAVRGQPGPQPTPRAGALPTPPAAAAASTPRLPAGLHAAETGRAAPQTPAPAPKAGQESPEAAAVGHRNSPQAAPVDLDLLAQEVYRRLRDRLSQEIRRQRS